MLLQITSAAVEAERESLMANEFLTTYPNDHLAGAQAALEMIDLLRDIDEPVFWREVGHEIESDRRELRRLIDAIGAPQSHARRAAAWMSEKLAELKMRVDDSRDGGLRRLELIEALALGIDGKRALWAVLQTTSEISPELGRLDYRTLIARAEDQRNRVEARRLLAAVDALVPAARPA